MSRRQLAFSGAALAATFILSAPEASAGRDSTFKINGQTLQVETLGASGPIVVFEAGRGNDATTWKRVAGPIARVVLYDRAGLGKSLPMMKNALPVTADEVAANLHGLIIAAAIPPPYILVDHSLGGLYVQMFAKKYPKEVLGVVLLESASPDAPAQLKTRAHLKLGTAAYLEEAGMPASNRQVKDGGPFPNVPLTVIAATDHGPYFRKWEPTLMNLQQQLAKLSPRGNLIVAHGSGHDVQIDLPGMVIEAVRRMAGIAKSAP